MICILMNFRFCFRLDNCRTGLELAFEHLGIPRIISPEHLSSDDMDELSGMTYMSYFMSGECNFVFHKHISKYDLVMGLTHLLKTVSRQIASEIVYH